MVTDEYIQITFYFFKKESFKSDYNEATQNPVIYLELHMARELDDL